MIISQLIEKLNTFKEKHGHLTIVVTQDEWYFHLEPERITIQKNISPIHEILEEEIPEELDEYPLNEFLLIGFPL